MRHGGPYQRHGKPMTISQTIVRLQKKEELAFEELTPREGGVNVRLLGPKAGRRLWWVAASPGWQLESLKELWGTKRIGPAAYYVNLKNGRCCEKGADLLRG